MGYEVFTDDLDIIDLKTKKIINTINPHSYIVAKKDLYFQEALKYSNVLIPDGSGIVMATKILNKKTIKKVTGADLHTFLLEKMDSCKGRVFYMGSSDDTLRKIEERIHVEYPNIKVKTYSPPYKDRFTKEENDVILTEVNSFRPNVLFVGMTAPKQEKWLYSNSEYLNYNIACSIGAVFDFYAGTINRPSQIWIKLHLEWLIRFIKEPRRLWKRNFISTPLFLLDLVKYKLKED